MVSGAEVLKQYDITMQTSKKKATKQPLSAFRAFEINTPAMLSGLLKNQCFVNVSCWLLLWARLGTRYLIVK